MKTIKRIIIILLVTTILFGCEVKDKNSYYEEERFYIGHTFNDNTVIHLALEVFYKDDDLLSAFLYDKLTLNGFINKLKYVDELNDGGSKIYRYNKNKKTFGDTSFYVIKCNSNDGIKDVFVAKYKENLLNLCSIEMDENPLISMNIKDGSLTRDGAKLIIKDETNRDNVYGEGYRIDKKENGTWVELKPIIDNYGFNLIGYRVNENNILELDCNWKWLYGSLSDGEYRIVKSTSESGEVKQHYFSVSFIIDKDVKWKK